MTHGNDIWFIDYVLVLCVWISSDMEQRVQFWTQSKSIINASHRNARWKSVKAHVLNFY